MRSSLDEFDKSYRANLTMHACRALMWGFAAGSLSALIGYLSGWEKTSNGWALIICLFGMSMMFFAANFFEDKAFRHMGRAIGLNADNAKAFFDAMDGRDEDGRREDPS